MVVSALTTTHFLASLRSSASSAQRMIDEVGVNKIRMKAGIGQDQIKVRFGLGQDYKVR